jgi:FtsH-binding integral membrane protein
MSTFPNPYGQPIPLEYGASADASVMRSFFNSVYAWMAAGLALTGCVAWWTSTQPQLIQHIYRSGLMMVLIIAELALVWIVSAAVRKIGAVTATVLFMLYAALNGLTLSALVLIYAHSLIASAFIVTAGTFAATSLYGFVTKRDLTSLGAYLFMGLIGIVIASVVSIFWHPTWLTVAINYIGVFLFIGLTAYDTQRLKAIALQTANDGALAARLSISGALMLYLDFLNLFLFILSILNNNDRRR